MFCFFLLLLSLAKPFSTQKHQQYFLTDTQLLMFARTCGMVQTQLTAEGPHNLGQVGSSIPYTAVSYLCAELCSRLPVFFHITAQQFQPITKQQ